MIFIVSLEVCSSTVETRTRIRGDRGVEVETKDDDKSDEGWPLFLRSEAWAAVKLIVNFYSKILVHLDFVQGRASFHAYIHDSHLSSMTGL